MRHKPTTLAHGRVGGKLLGERRVCGDLIGLARIKFDTPGRRPLRFRVIDRQVNEHTRHWRSSGTTTTFSEGLGSGANSDVETFVETPVAYIVCILGIPGTAAISLCRQIAWCGRHAHF